jgi:aryl-alcohol dehydrogenase-like predicted oxidoreductase
MKLPEYDWLKERVIDSEQGQAAIRKADEVAGIAGELGVTPAQLAIAWCLKNPDVSTVILGASRKEQLLENLAALDTVQLLTDDVMETLEGVLNNRPELPTQF